MASVKNVYPSLRRETILDAAIRLFQQRGFDGLGMRQIADCLQIRAPSLYHHFASKEDLARQALRQYREEQATRLLAIAERSDLSEKLQMYAELFTEMLNDGKRPCMYLVMVREPSVQEGSCAEELRLFAKQNVDWLEAILRRGKCEPVARAGVPERSVAEIIFASLEGLMAISLADKKPSVAFRKRATDFLKVVMNSLK